MSVPWPVVLREHGNEYKCRKQYPLKERKEQIEMEIKKRKESSEKDRKSNGGAYARGRNQTMSAQVERRKLWVLVDLKRKSKYKNEVIKYLSDSPAGMASARRLFLYTGYSNITIFKRSVLLRLHNDELVYFDEVAEMVQLTRLGWLVARHAKL